MIIEIREPCESATSVKYGSISVQLGHHVALNSSTRSVLPPDTSYGPSQFSLASITMALEDGIEMMIKTRIAIM